VRDVGVVVVSELGHKVGICSKKTLYIRREDEQPVDLDAVMCEGCGCPVTVSKTTRAIAEISKAGILAYRVLTELDGIERPTGPWRYVPVGAWR
jgi:hypothetical protein